MRVFNEDKTKELKIEELDFDLGHLKDDVLKIHHDAIPEVKEVKEEGHYEVIAEYENGGKDLEWVIDVEHIDGKPEVPEYDEEENIYVYILFSEKEIRENEILKEIEKLKSELSSTDYKAIKYSEGLYTEEEYEPIKKERQRLRDEINKLRDELDKLEEK